MLIDWRTLRARLGGIQARISRRNYYDAWLHFGIADTCNLRCHYCISDSPGFPAAKKTGGKIAPIRIDALMRSLQRTGRTFRIVFAGSGEPFLVPNLVDAVRALTGRHFVGIHTNLTVEKPVLDLIRRVRPKRILKIHASAHVQELRRTGRMDCFVRCFRNLQQSGFPVTAEAVAHPGLLTELPQYKRSFRRLGIELRFGAFIGMHEGRVYPEAYSPDERSKFGLGDPGIFRTRGTLCNAGFNVGLVLPNGDIRFCTEVERRIGNVYEHIEFRDTPLICPAERCRCPFYAYDDGLFHRAKEAHALVQPPGAG